MLFSYIRSSLLNQNFFAQGPVTFTLDSRKFEYVDYLNVTPSAKVPGGASTEDNVDK